MTSYSFRQGIARYPTAIGGTSFTGSQGQAFLQVSGNFVNLLADNGPTVVHFGHKNTNYEFTETDTVNNAWDLTAAAGAPAWIYWDIDASTGVRTFGFTLLQPTSGPTAPANPVNDQHWYDTTTATMKVFNAATGRFAERIRVFAAHIQSATSILPLGSNAARPFAGSQVGLDNSPNKAGRILFDETGEPIVRISNRTFVTTEDQFFSTASRLNGIRLESDVITATATENLAAYSIVEWFGTGQVRLANYNNSQDTAVGVAVEDTLLGESVTVVVQGVITNEQWNWQNIGAPLWILNNGVLTDVDPNIADPITYPQRRAPVARILAPRQIIFQQGLGAVGPRGPEGPPADQVKATNNVLGNVILSVPPLGGSGSPLIVGGSPIAPIAVGTNDPRLAGGPFVSLTHLSSPGAHTAANIDFVSYGNIGSTNVQGAIEELEDEKVSIAGDTMTGFLTLNSDPVNDLHAATKNYVDNLVSGLIWLDPVCLMNLISDNVTTAPVSPNTGDAYIMPTGVLTGWGSPTPVQDDVVQWNGVAWENGGNLDTNFPSARFVVSGTSSTVPSGTFAGQNNNVAVRGGSPVWSYEIPVENNAVFVCNEFSAEAFGQFVFDDDASIWVQFNGGQVVPGSNLTLNGNILDVRQWSGSPAGTVDAATLQGNEPSDFAPALHRHNYDLAAFIAGVAVLDEPVGSWLLVRDLDVPVDFTGSLANAATAGAADPSVLNILQNGSIVGTITFPATVNAGTFASVGSPPTTAFSIGDLVTLQWGSPAPDSAIKNVTVTIETCADAPQC